MVLTALWKGLMIRDLKTLPSLSWNKPIAFVFPGHLLMDGLFIQIISL